MFIRKIAHRLQTLRGNHVDIRTQVIVRSKRGNLDIEEFLLSGPAGHDGLCAQCSLVDWRKIFASEDSGRQLQIRLYWSTDSTASCQLCWFFWSMTYVTPSNVYAEDKPTKSLLENRDGPVPQYYWVEVDKLSRQHWLTDQCDFLLPDGPDLGASVVATIPTGVREFPCNRATIGTTITQSQSSASTSLVRLVKLNPNSIDYNAICSWLSDCEHSHRFCHPFDHSPDGVKEARPHLAGFRLIDCESREIVSAQLTTKFAALSYVWGEPERDASDSDAADFEQNKNTLPRSPKTIEDAIMVTQKLGLRFLWVDRYCIEQGSNAQRLAQIRQMNLIYKSAFVTIVAAAGSDPRFGLPGVSDRLRTVQAECQIDNLSLISSFNNPVEVIQKSKWASRAWTYQEACLSRRRLAFTEQQVYFQCYQCSASEVLPQLSRSRSWAFQNVYGKESVAAIWDMIQSYVRRKLTYDADTISAFEGVMQELISAKAYLTFHFGIPVETAPSNKEATTENDNDVSEAKHGSASPQVSHATKSFLEGLSWTHDLPVHRRGQFPSWAWAGWKFSHAAAAKIAELCSGVLSAMPNFSLPQVFIEDTKGALHNVPDLGTDHMPSQQLSRFINLRAPVFEVAIRIIPLKKPDQQLAANKMMRPDSYGTIGLELILAPWMITQMCFLIELTSMEDHIHFQKLADEGYTEVRGVIGVILGRYAFDKEGMQMLVLRRRDGYYERLGTACLRTSLLSRRRKLHGKTHWLAPSELPPEAPTYDDIQPRLNDPLIRAIESMADHAKNSVNHETTKERLPTYERMETDFEHIINEIAKTATFEMIRIG